MADETIAIRVKMIGGEAVVTEAKAVSGAVSGTGKAATTATASQSKFRSGVSKLGSAIKYSAIPGLALLGYGLTSSIGAYREARKVGEQTNAVIKSTGGVANVTADQVAKLANSISLKTGVDDEDIQAGENLLLTFKNIRNEVGKGNDIFNQATEVITDMSSALGQDMKASSIQLGKALNDPIKGITALSRVGVTFDEQQTKMIQKLVKSGNVLGAQKIILRELTSEFGGSARAQHDAVDRLGVAWENLQETLGKALYPILRNVTNWLTKALQQAQKGKGPLIDLKNAVVGLAKGFWTLIAPLRWILEHVDDLVNALNDIEGFASNTREITPADLPTSPNPIRGGGHHGGTSNVGAEPGHGKTDTSNRAHRGSGKLHVHVNLRGKQVGEAVIDETQIAAAWG